MRAIAICAALAACGQPVSPGRATASGAAAASGSGAPSTAAASAPGAPSPPRPTRPPGPRLADGIVPIAYDLTLELDPDRGSFVGHVAITIAVAAPATTQIWLHAVDLNIASAKLVRPSGATDDAILLAGGADMQMRGFGLPRPVGNAASPETVTLGIDYTGPVSDLSVRSDNDEQGLFRERADGRWYLYSQAESVFARKIAPCFDEPRFKPAWRVTLIVPPHQVALGNAPVLAERARSDGYREIRFAAMAALPSYLLAVAVGPFELVDAGRLGRGHTPVRLAVAAGDGARLGYALRELPRIIDAVERYVDAPLPLAKLDLVAVPQFFGAMENPGLILFDRDVLVRGNELVSVVAHELAHQWFGDSVTPVWWDQLWLSEAFATWLAERITASLEGAEPAVLAHGARAAALAADDAIAARPLIRPIATSDDVEPAFDAIAYDKGSALIATFERFAGPAAFQAAVRAYLGAHAGASVGSQAFLDALAGAAGPAVADALASNLAVTGTPVVELALRCGAAPAVVAAARGATVPVCVRFPASRGASATTATCFLAGARAEHALPAAAGCPAWLVSNDGGRGYYRVVWAGAAPMPPVAAMSPTERLARGDDAAAAVLRGELPPAAALDELTRLAATREPAGELAALSIARAIDSLVAEPLRPAWTRWLASRFAHRVTPRALLTWRSRTDDLVRDALVDLAGDAIAPAVLATARATIVRHPDADHDPIMLRLAAARDADQLFDHIVAAAAAASDDRRDELLADLAAFPAGYAARVADLLIDPRFGPRSGPRSGPQSDARSAPAPAWPALAALLERRATSAAAWTAIHARFAAIFDALSPAQRRDAVTTAASLCEARARDELAADMAPRIAANARATRADRTADRSSRRAASHSAGPGALDHILTRTLATIDRCIARRAAAGDLAAALAAASTPHR